MDYASMARVLDISESAVKPAFSARGKHSKNSFPHQAVKLFKETAVVLNEGAFMNCEEIKKLLEEFTGSEMPGDRMKEVSGHLGTCPACRKEHESLAQIAGALSRLPYAGRARNSTPGLWPG